MSDSSSTLGSDSDNNQAMNDYPFGVHYLGQSGFTLKPDIWHSWLDFVYVTRIQEGQATFMAVLPRNRGCCGRSRQSYPHWPPSTVQESFD